MMKKNTSDKKTRRVSAPKPEAVENKKMERMGTKIGKTMDGMAEAPGNLAHSAKALANGTRRKASRAASKAAKDVALRIDSDDSKRG